MAEGFVRERHGMTREDVAEEYFYELINRSLIQPSRVGVDGEIESCRVHDIMRELVVAKSIEENLVFIAGENENVMLMDNVRHLVLTSSREIEGANLSHVRSLSVFDASVPSLLPSPSKMKMLRMLDLENRAPYNEDKASRDTVKQAIQHLGQMKYLKYICLKSDSENLREFVRFIRPLFRTICPLFWTKNKLPESLRNLRDLQTLDIRNSEIEKVPNGITKLQKLRHLLAYDVVMPKGTGNLKELQVLEYVDIKRSHGRVVEELAKLRQLKRLGVTNLTRGKWKKLSTSIGKLSSLRSLWVMIESREEEAVGCLDGVSSPPEHLRSMRLEGWIEKLPIWVPSLHNLAKINLWHCRLEDDAIVVLQKLPNLIVLHLYFNAYVGPKLIFQKDAFPKLRVLVVMSLDNLEELLFEENTLPEFESLEISNCELKSGISGIEHLSRLKKLVLNYKVFVANLDTVLRQVGEHHNHPALEVRDPEYQKEMEEKYC